ncbi:MFS transporter [Kutzneria buriramensis]|uniref:MFS transporter n=1 Tax=Kutzneria buriramensis TaxID=1045776 RepID=UPI001FE925F8|nr:MFS transporter [Kutzneria buriramensis]
MSVLDLSPWRASRDYRLLWSSGAVSLMGSLITYVTVPLQIKQLTDSYLAVGATGAVELVPMVVFGLYGGALADAVDRGRIVLLAEVGLGVLSLLLLVNSLLPHPMLWLIYLVVALASALDGLQRPALEALVPRIVSREHMTAAIALSSLRFNVGTIVGPAIGGLIAATLGVSVAYSCDLVSFVFAITLLSRLKAAPPPSNADKPSLRGILQGLSYAGSRPELLGTYLVDIAAMLLAMPNAVFPFLADELGSNWALGMMYAATSVGALAGDPHQRLDVEGAPARADGRAGGGRLGTGDGRRRLVRNHLARPVLPRRRRRGRRRERDLPLNHLEQHHSGPFARPAGRHRAAQLQHRAAAVADPGGRRGHADRRARVDLDGRPGLCRSGALLGRSARLHPLRRSDLGPGVDKSRLSGVAAGSAATEDPLDSYAELGGFREKEQSRAGRGGGVRSHDRAGAGDRGHRRRRRRRPGRAAERHRRHA